MIGRVSSTRSPFHLIVCAMFLQLYHRSAKSSYFIILALGISLMVHGFFVLFVQQDARATQSGSTSRISVAMHKSANSAVNNTQKIIQNTSQKVIPEVSPKHELKSIRAPKVVATKRSVEMATQIDIPRTAKPTTPINETITKATPVKREKNVTEEHKKHSTNVAVRENFKTQSIAQNQSLQSSVASQDGAQTKRYEIGSNNNPKPSYPSLAVKRGWQGQVVLGVHVNPDGSIEHLTFVKSTDYGVLNFEAYETVRTSWHFTPLENESDLSKSSYIEVPITFNIANR